MELEIIDGFKSPGEVKRFEIFLEAHVESGDLEEIPADPAYRHGEIVGGRWFRVIKDGSIWRLISPDSPFAGLFEPVILTGRKSPRH